MGETGCGKTCLIRYMCGLQSGPGGPKNMLLMKVDIFLLLFVYGCVCAWGVWVQGGSFFFFPSLLFLFRLAGNADVFSVVAFVRPNSDICEPETPKDFCDVIPFVLLITTEIKE